MSKPFDVATKQLVESNPLAWLRFLGLQGETAELIDADLATVVAEADRVLRVTNPDYLAHFELQASYRKDMGDRMFFYNAVAYYRYRQPVESAVLLLRKEADGPALSGRVAYASLDFRYHVVRLWEKSVEEALSSPLALLPLAPLTNVVASELPAIVRRMEAHIDAEAPAEEKGLLWTTTWLLLGLKYNPEFSRQLLKGVIAMKESATYQYTLEEGRVEGRAEGRAQEARRILLLLGEKRFGRTDAPTQLALDAISSPERLEQLIERVMEAENWAELLD
jgi:predicted transposase YdaD